MKTELIKARGEDKMDSKYYATWEEYLAVHPELEGKPTDVIAPKIQKYEDAVFSFIMDLLL
ncbi:hypothetical protein [Desulfosporosinus fructosivorans]|uniref:hypothetical protein n=1 Tax=Desulfosporosinus fructosivorans TaxID=2018669 RepID=UPI0010804AEA|nr:hypothetical protein [Desulfosporosinus fructosivorans]